MLHAHAASPGYWTLAAMWFAMMAAMMAPTVWPWVRSFHRLGGARMPFAGGYLTAWLAYSLAAAALQTAIRAPESLAPFVFVAAGVYQLVPLKRACLTHCRSPFGYFLARWRSGPAGAFRMGAAHGVYCVGCCWALMAIALVVGVMSVAWMAALALVAFVEQVTPHGDRLRRPIGVALIAAAAVGRF